MKWLFGYILKTWNKILGRSVPYKSIWIDELPDELNLKTMYVVGENNHLWCAAMICPCGCGSILQMGLMQDQRPRWTVVRHDDGTVSLSPSVWRKVGCKSHFWFRRGKVVWCSD